MKCRLCEKFFNTDSSFIFLFSFPEICPECQRKFKPVLKEEKIPIDNGEITYLYLYDFNLNLHQRNYLDRHFKIIYRCLLQKKEEYDIVIMLDTDVMKTFSEWGEFVKPFKRIMLVSISFYDLSHFNFLY